MMGPMGCPETSASNYQSALCNIPEPVVHPGIFSGGWGGSINSVEDRGQRERGYGRGSPLVRGSAQFANEWNPYYS
jgi:hypothetical protein